MVTIPRMKSRYVYRDSWTRLNVTPAKIMQVCDTIHMWNIRIQMQNCIIINFIMYMYMYVHEFQCVCLLFTCMYNVHIQQEKVIAEIQTHLDCTQERGSTSEYDKATLAYLVALNRIFENGLLSQKPVSDFDSSPLKNIEAGFKFFEEWCDEALNSGMVTKINFHMSTYICTRRL